MTADELSRIKKHVMARYERYSNMDLAGMIADCHAYLDQSKIIRLARHKTKKTGDEQVRFVVHCEPRSSTITVPDIVSDLERIWLNDLCLTEEAHVIIRTDENVILDFVTWSPKPTAYVTGQIACIYA